MSMSETTAGIDAPRLTRVVIPTEYIIVSDKTSMVLKSSTDKGEIVKSASDMRKADGEITVFMSTRL